MFKTWHEGEEGIVRKAYQTTSLSDVGGFSNATRIWSTIRMTSDGSTPADSPEPSSSLNDGSISGNSGIFQVFASAGQKKRLKARFRGENGVGYELGSQLHDRLALSM